MASYSNSFGWFVFAIGGNDTWPCSTEAFQYGLNSSTTPPAVFGCWCPEEGTWPFVGSNLPAYYPMNNARADLGVATTQNATHQIIFAVGGTGDGQNTLSSVEMWAVDNTVDYVSCNDDGSKKCPPANAATKCSGGPPTPIPQKSLLQG